MNMEKLLRKYFRITKGSTEIQGKKHRGDLGLDGEITIFAVDLRESWNKIVLSS